MGFLGILAIKQGFTVFQNTPEPGTQKVAFLQDEPSFVISI